MATHARKGGVLYVGPLDPNGTCFARFRALREIEDHVESFDSSFVGHVGPRVYRQLENRFSAGYSFMVANHALLERSKSLGPSVMWVDKGFWIWPETLATLKDMGVFLVQHNTDDVFASHGRWSYRLLRSTVKDYAVHFTTNHGNVPEYLAAGAPKVELTHLGYDHHRFFPRPLTDREATKWSCDVVFVGHWEPDTEELVVALVDARVPVTVYGWNWRRARRWKRLSGVVHSEYLGGEDYVNAIRGAKIALGFLSKKNRNQTAGRTFEIPSCRTFFLAERTTAHQRLYQEGAEAEFFSDGQELIRKVGGYLNDHSRRDAIAGRGYQRCISSGYSYLDHMKKDWEIVMQMLRRVGGHE